MIELPIVLKMYRPLERPESPYGRCGQCQYIGVDAYLGGNCPSCHGSFSPYGPLHWPSPEFIELWDDLVFAWNHERPELVACIAAMYFEAHVFDLIKWGTHWLDPELNWIGAEFSEVKDKSERIWAYLNRINSPKKTVEALRKLFGVDGKKMLEIVLDDQAAPFWQNYQKLAHFRNNIVHKARRVLYRTIKVQQDRSVADRMLSAGIH